MRGAAGTVITAATGKVETESVQESRYDAEGLRF